VRKTQKRLAVNAQTIRKLGLREMFGVHGGSFSDTNGCTYSDPCQSSSFYTNQQSCVTIRPNGPA
jgi:hypothetical protein